MFVSIDRIGNAAATIAAGGVASNERQEKKAARLKVAEPENEYFTVL